MYVVGFHEDLQVDTVIDLSHTNDLTNCSVMYELMTVDTFSEVLRVINRRERPNSFNRYMVNLEKIWLTWIILAKDFSKHSDGMGNSPASSNFLYMYIERICQSM